MGVNFFITSKHFVCNEMFSLLFVLYSVRQDTHPQNSICCFSCLWIRKDTTCLFCRETFRDYNKRRRKATQKYFFDCLNFLHFSLCRTVL